jgi:hypothetical protein
VPRAVVSWMKHRNPLRILAISGSLRRASSNSALIEATAILPPATIEVSAFRSSGKYHRSIRISHGFVANIGLSTMTKAVIDALAVAAREAC